MYFGAAGTCSIHCQKQLDSPDSDLYQGLGPVYKVHPFPFSFFSFLFYYHPYSIGRIRLFRCCSTKPFLPSSHSRRHSTNPHTIVALSSFYYSILPSPLFTSHLTISQPLRYDRRPNKRHRYLQRLC